MKFKIGDKVKTTIGFLPGEWIVYEVYEKTRVYGITNDGSEPNHCIHENDLEAAQKFQVGQAVRIRSLANNDVNFVGEIVSIKPNGEYEITSKHFRFESEIEPY